MYLSHVFLHEGNIYNINVKIRNFQLEGEVNNFDVQILKFKLYQQN